MWTDVLRILSNIFGNKQTKKEWSKECKYKEKKIEKQYNKVYSSFLPFTTKYHKISCLKSHIIISQSLGKDSEHLLAESFAQSLMKVLKRCWPHCIPIWRVNFGRIHLQTHSSYWQNYLPGFQLEAALRSCWLGTLPCHIFHLHHYTQKLILRWKWGPADTFFITSWHLSKIPS